MLLVFCICAEANVGEGLADGDLLVGQLLKLSTMQCPSLAKTWFTLANWCYKWGRRAVDNAAYVQSQKFYICEKLLPFWGLCL